MGPLARKYVWAFLLTVMVPLGVSGSIESWFGYEEQKKALQQLLKSEARSAASKVEGFVSNIREHAGWFVQLPWTEERDERRRIDALRMLRQVPSVISITLVDQHGRERLHVSRLGLNRIESKRDVSESEDIREAKRQKVWFSPVTYKRGSEPHVLIAIAGARDSAGAAILEVNLKHVWDTVSAISIGRTGKAYIADDRDRLVAHPDLSLVLRGENAETHNTLSRARAAVQARQTWISFGGTEVIGAGIDISAPNWTVYLEQSVSEAYEPVRASLSRTAWILLCGLLFAALLAVYFAQRMVGPILTLQLAAREIGRGNLGHRVEVKTADEIQELGDVFNEMATELGNAQDRRERIERLKRFLDPHVAELVDSSSHSSLLESKRAEVAVLFCDLRGFTTFAVAAPADEVMDLLSQYHHAIGQVVQKNGATLLSFLGDGVMILINAPLPCAEPALTASRMGLELQALVQPICKSWQPKGRTIGFGVGIAMGPATVGRIGFESRMDYAAIGSVTNLAARMCSVAGDGEILIDSRVAAEAGSELAVRFTQKMSMKGFPELVEVYRVDQSAEAGSAPLACLPPGDIRAAAPNSPA